MRGLQSKAASSSYKNASAMKKTATMQHVPRFPQIFTQGMKIREVFSGGEMTDSGWNVKWICQTNVYLNSQAWSVLSTTKKVVPDISVK